MTLDNEYLNQTERFSFPSIVTMEIFRE